MKARRAGHAKIKVSGVRVCVHGCDYRMKLGD